VWLEIQKFDKNEKPTCSNGGQNTLETPLDGITSVGEWLGTGKGQPS
jgi:hypothetical protein